MGLHPLDVARQKVDEEIEALYERIRELKSKRNSLVHISTLPTELLCHVFLECRGEWLPLRMPWIVQTYLAITATCKEWRSAAIAYPGLWSHVSTDVGFTWMEALASRSKAALLSVKILQNSGEDFLARHLKLASSVLQESHNLERVAIQAYDEGLQELLDHLKAPMPNLRHLNLVNQGNDWFPLPSPFLANHAPQLRKITPDNFDLPWTSTFLDGLESLSVLNTGRETTPILRPSSDIFLDALTRMSRLTYLNLERVLPLDLPRPPNVLIAMPLLRFIRLRGTCAECNSVLQHVQLHRLTVVELELEEIDESEFKGFCDTLWSSWLSGPLSGKQRELQWDRLWLGGNSNLDFTIQMGAGPFGPPSPGELKIDVFNSDWTLTDHARLMDSLRVLLRNATVIFIDSVMYMLPPILQATFASLTSVTELAIAGNAVNIFKPLLNDTQADTDSAIHTKYLPKLTTIRLRNTYFGKGDLYCLDLHDLERWLRFRRASGAGLKELHIVDCWNISSAAYNTLRGCIGGEGTVFWDGKA